MSWCSSELRTQTLYFFIFISWLYLLLRRLSLSFNFYADYTQICINCSLSFFIDILDTIIIITLWVFSNLLKRYLPPVAKASFYPFLNLDVSTITYSECVKGDYQRGSNYLKKSLILFVIFLKRTSNLGEGGDFFCLKIQRVLKENHFLEKT